MVALFSRIINPLLSKDNKLRPEQSTTPSQNNDPKKPERTERHVRWADQASNGSQPLATLPQTAPFRPPRSEPIQHLNRLRPYDDHGFPFASGLDLIDNVSTTTCRTHRSSDGVHDWNNPWPAIHQQLWPSTTAPQPQAKSDSSPSSSSFSTGPPSVFVRSRDFPVPVVKEKLPPHQNVRARNMRLWKRCWDEVDSKDHTTWMHALRRYRSEYVPPLSLCEVEDESEEEAVSG